MNNRDGDGLPRKKEKGVGEYLQRGIQFPSRRDIFREGEKDIFPVIYREEDLRVKLFQERKLASKGGRAEGGRVPNFQVNLS